ncbi:MAG: aminoacetone oxidase family FAD-binding enzyme [Lachnospiraceae bacterium]|nr:aminoacetone oxidase family FAD-binding enzyme [Lachnospiraceae bacterium]
MKRVAVIGAGASGMLAAIAASLHSEVSVFDKNEYPGRKLLQTGNGKCNFTNEDISPDRYRGSLRDKGILDAVLKEYDRDFLLDLFRSYGLLYHEKNKGFYPRSDSAGSVNDVLIRKMKLSGVRFHGSVQVKSIEKGKDGRFFLTLYHLKDNKKTRDETGFDAVIVASGGKSAPKTGSTGDAYYFAEEFGLTVVPPLPALTRLLSDDKFFNDNNVRAEAAVSLYIDGVNTCTSKGELQITNTGPSGICVFDLSGRAAAALKAGKKCELSADLLPEYGEDEIFTMLKEHAGSLSKEDFKAGLFLGIFSERLSLNVYEKIRRELFNGKELPSDLSDTDLRRIAAVLKDMRFSVNGTGEFSVSQVTSGGIHADSLNPDLSAKKVPGLFFAGECLDTDGDCGGFNLHWAFVSGYKAGSSAIAD